MLCLHFSVLIDLLFKSTILLHIHKNMALLGLAYVQNSMCIALLHSIGTVSTTEIIQWFFSISPLVRSLASLIYTELEYLHNEVLSIFLQ